MLSPHPTKSQLGRVRPLERRWGLAPYRWKEIEPIMQRIKLLTTCCLFLSISLFSSLNWAQTWQAGLAQLDITPEEPLRLSGYASRQDPSEGVADKLTLRVLALSNSESRDHAEALSSAKPLILVSVDAIAIPGSFTVELSGWLQEKHQIPRSHLVVCCTHAHTTPHLPGSIDNILRVELSETQIAASLRYLARLQQTARSAIDQAMSKLQPAKVEFGDAESSFAVNRRVVKEGRWINFGVQADGAVDHRVRVMKISSPQGKLLGAAFQYACHCTTLGPEFNQISADWAGLCASQLQTQFPEAVFVPVIGCGADINPNPRGGYEFAKQHGKALADAVQKVLSQKLLVELPPSSVAQFGTAGLEPELPTNQRLEDYAKGDNPNQQRWAARMLEIRKAMGRFPESVPMPMHVWAFGDALTWVFLSGEPVVEYQFAIEKELSSKATWVAGYSDDLFAYVASQAQRSEGGYEVDESMIYFLQPGRWKSGTQAEIVARASSIGKQTRGEDEPLGPVEALRSMHVPNGYRVEQRAAEPMVQDPVNIAFGLDGSVWVVEMADYPLGVEGGGRVKVLRDTNGDGVLDKSSVFLTGLGYPTGVQPWRKGVVVIAAPDVLYAEDTDGDDVADLRKPLLSGIHEANPQHRASGFEIGLDGRLHFGTGDGTRELYSHVNGQKYEVKQRDVAWNPDTGEVEVMVQAQTQFMPARDSFGNWFGSNNYQPMFQFVFEAAEVAGKPNDVGVVNHLLTPGDAPPVYPRSKTSDRFNDMYSRERYTSACSSTIVRVPGLYPQGYRSDGMHPIGLICEPVHNLVARVQLHPRGSAFGADRHPEDEKFDFLASTDPWARLVRAVNAPDGTVWFVDMYRRVIEHPEWIPNAWQQRIDLRGGAGLGRIYRVYHESYQPYVVRNLRGEDPFKLLTSPIGPLRDLATQAIITDQFDVSVIQTLPDRLRSSLKTPIAPEVAASILGVMAGKKWLQPADLVGILQKSDDPQLVRWGLKLASRFESPSQDLQAAVSSVPARKLGAAVDLQWLLTVHRWPNFTSEVGLAAVLASGTPDRWMSAALNFNNSPQTAEPILRMLLKVANQNTKSMAGLQEQLSTVRRLLKLVPEDSLQPLLLEYLQPHTSSGERTAAEMLILCSAREFCKTDKCEQALNAASQAVSQQIEQLAKRSPESQHWILLAIGNQVVAQDQEIELLDQLLHNTAWVSWAIERSRFVGSDQTAEILIRQWQRLTVQDQGIAAGILMSRPSWRGKVVQALEAGDIKAAQLPAAVLQSLISQQDRNLRSRAIAVLGQPSPRQKVISDYQKQLPNPNLEGDVARGEAVFKQQCAVCHSAQNGKPSVGPAIDNLAHWTTDQWLTAVLDPNQIVEEKYKQTTILTKEGQVIAGIVTESSVDMLRVVASDGNIQQVPLAEVDEQKRSTISLMPEGFEAKLTPQQMADLIRFLRKR